MKHISIFSAGLFFIFIYFFLSCAKEYGEDTMSRIPKAEVKTAIEKLVSAHGETERYRIEKGVKQTAQLWRKEDGDVESFTQFCTDYFIADSAILAETFNRFEKNLESVFGHLHGIRRDLQEPMDLDIGPMLPVDYLFAEYSPTAHVHEDFFKSKIAFVALLNFPQYTLEEKLKLGPHWSRQQWAQMRLAELFATRVPPEIRQKQDQAYVAANNYINNYNLYMHHILSEEGNRLFPPGLRLLTHWNLRDEIRGLYLDPEGLAKQKLIQTIMEKIILQEIPETVINNPSVDWNVSTNEVTISPVNDTERAETPASIDNRPEPDTRYATLLKIFHAERLADPFYPTMPTLMDRRFQHDRQIPEAEVEALLKAVLSSPLIGRTAKIIEKRLRRPLQPFDIWYNGFKAKGTYPESELDRIVSKKYPNPTAFQNDLPNILRKLGFSSETAFFLASKIVVDPARGSGHAMGAQRREDNAHLRTRILSTGMNYKGYNIAVHEFGHNCEQVLSLNRIDHTLLNGVPNTGFTEAFAFVFQNRDLDLLGLAQKEPYNDYSNALDNLWSTYEIAGVSLVDMTVWHWMYDHPKATPAELKAAVIRIAQDIWNTYYAPLFGKRDVVLLAIYSHMIGYGLYLPDYPLGHIIAFQIEQYLKDKNLGGEMERMCSLGSITPDAWMQAALGKPISAEPMLKAAENALHVFEQ